MTSELTGAERYLASRMDDSDYREAYEAAVTGPMNVITLYQPYGVGVARRCHAGDGPASRHRDCAHPVERAK